jgi:hypothetical protein
MKSLKRTHAYQQVYERKKAYILADKEYHKNRTNTTPNFVALVTAIYKGTIKHSATSAFGDKTFTVSCPSHLRERHRTDIVDPILKEMGFGYYLSENEQDLKAFPSDDVKEGTLGHKFKLAYERAINDPVGCAFDRIVTKYQEDRGNGTVVIDVKDYQCYEAMERFKALILADGYVIDTERTKYYEGTNSGVFFYYQPLPEIDQQVEKELEEEFGKMSD